MSRLLRSRNSHSRLALALIISLEATLPTMLGNGSNIPQQIKPLKTSTLSIKTTIDAEYLVMSDTSSWPFGRRAVWPPKYIAFVEVEEREPNYVLDRPVHRYSRPRLPRSPRPSAKRAAAVAASVSPPAAGEVRGTIFGRWDDCILSVEACACGYEEAPCAASLVESNEESDLIGLSFDCDCPGPDRETENATTSVP